MNALGGSCAPARDDNKCPESFRGKFLKHRAAERAIHRAALVGIAAFSSGTLFAAENAKNPEQSYRTVIDNPVACVPGLQACVRHGKSREMRRAP